MTKRNVVSLIGKFYNPLGFLAPVTIKFKVFFQKLCRDKLEWDVNLPEELVKEWNDLVNDLGEGGPEATSTMSTDPQLQSCSADSAMH